MCACAYICNLWGHMIFLKLCESVDLTLTSSIGKGPLEFSATLIGGITQSLFVRLRDMSIWWDGNTISGISPLSTSRSCRYTGHRWRNGFNLCNNGLLHFTANHRHRSVIITGRTHDNEAPVQLKKHLRQSFIKKLSLCNTPQSLSPVNLNLLQPLAIHLLYITFWQKNKLNEQGAITENTPALFSFNSMNSF